MWHSITWEEAVRALGSDFRQGLALEEAELRKEKYGLNLLPREKPLSGLHILFGQFKSPLIYILLIAGIIVLTFKDYTDALVIFGAVVINTFVGYLQENKANKSLSKLKDLINLEAEVIREGNRKIVDSSELVPGDIIILNSGSKVPADARIISCDNFKVNEMALTGEWISAEKKNDSLKLSIDLADRDNMAYMGTVAEDGRAKAIVVETGLNTEIGKIAEMVSSEKEEKTPLQKKISKFSSILGIVIIALCLLIFVEGMIAGNSFIEMFTIAVAVSVAAVPEGLPVAMTVILALGMQRIMKKKGLVRKLSSAETLGSCSVIATDKTGTLTEGKMEVAEISAKTEEDKRIVLEIAVLTAEAFIENPDDSASEWVVRGKPTDKALLLAGMHAGMDKSRLESKLLKIAELPFNPKNKYLAKAFSISKNRDIIYIAGAPEKLLRMASFVSSGGEALKMTSELEEEIRINVEDLASRGLRVVAMGYKEIDNLKNLFEDIVFAGLIALRDPIRKEAYDAIRTCKEAGMTPIIVTGDHMLTAVSVAKELGINTDNVLEGKDLDEMSDQELSRVVGKIGVYARVEPLHKMRIISAWQERGEVIAMTGDGINDAPALKKADIGVALGSGTEVAKEVSDLVLISDNFDVMVSAVEEGRGIIDNIRKVITYLLSSSFTETILIGASIVFGFPIPVTAGQILWINLIEDGLPNAALAFEPKEKDIMKQRPYGHNAPLLDLEMKILIFVIGILTDIFLLGLFFYLYKFTDYSMDHIRTMIFSGLAIDSIFYILSCKSLRKNIWKINPLSNKLLVGAWLFSIIILIATIYLAPLQNLLKVVPLNFYDWLILGGLGLSNLVLIEITKLIFISRR